MQAMDMRTQKLTKALFRAIQCEDVEAIGTLLKQGADINAKLIDDCWNSPLHKAAEDNRLHSAVLLLKSDTKGETPLLTAIRKGHLQFTEILLSCGSPINTARNKRHELMTLLLQRGADPNGRDHLGTYDCTALHHASQQGVADMVKELLDNNAVPDIKNEWLETPLHMAAESGNADCVSLLLNSGANSQIQNFEGMTPLHKAAMNGMFDCIEVLTKHAIQNQFSLDIKDNSGDTPLHAAIKKNQGACAAFLIKHGAIIDTRDWNGNTPLHSAATRGNAQLVEFIVKCHPNYPIAMLNKNGNTALHMAAHVGSAPCVNVLVNNGAPITPLSRSPKDEAAYKGHTKVANLFRVVDARHKSPFINNEIPEGVMANNFSSTISDLLFPSPSSPSQQHYPKDISTTTPAFNMGLAQTLGHFHTLLSPPKSKVQQSNNNNNNTTNKPKQQKSPSKFTSYSSPAYKKSLSSSGKSRSQLTNKINSLSIGAENGNGTDNNQQPNSENKKEQETREREKELQGETDDDDEESDVATEVNLDYSVSEFDDEDDGDSIANLQISKTISKNKPILQPVPVDKKDDSVDMITEIVIKKL